MRSMAYLYVLKEVYVFTNETVCFYCTFSTSIKKYLTLFYNLKVYITIKKNICTYMNKEYLHLPFKHKQKNMLPALKFLDKIV